MVGGRTKPITFAALIAKIQPSLSTTSVRDKQLVYRQGDAADAIFYVSTGQIKLAVSSKSGREAIVGLCGPTKLFGEGCLLGNHPLRLSDATSIGPSTIVRLERKIVAKSIHEDVDFAEVFVQYLVNRTKRVEEDLVDHLFNSSEKRLARALLLLANFGSEDEPPPVLPPINQATLAQLIGASRPKVSRFLNKFRDLGFISYNGKLRVHKSLLNVVLRDD